MKLAAKAASAVFRYFIEPPRSASAHHDDGNPPSPYAEMSYTSTRAAEFRSRIVLGALVMLAATSFYLILRAIHPALAPVLSLDESLLELLCAGAAVLASRRIERLRILQILAISLVALPITSLLGGGALNAPHTLIMLFLLGLLFPWTAGESAIAVLAPIGGFKIARLAAGLPLVDDDSATVGLGAVIVICAQYFSERARRLSFDRANEIRTARAEQDQLDAMAATIHKGIISGDLRTSGLEVRVRYEPMRLMGGDYVKMREISPGRTAMLMADVTGHGAPAALMVNRINAEVERLLARGDGPAESARELNEFVQRQFAGTGLFMTAIWAEYNAQAEVMRWVNYGHPPPLLLDPRQGVGRFLEGGVPPMGMGFETERPVSDLSLAAGQWVLFHTDGLTPGDFTGTRLLEFLEGRARRETTGERVINELVEKVIQVQNFSLTDDLLAVLWEPVARIETGEM
jgi:hypothetical protein